MTSRFQFGLCLLVSVLAASPLPAATYFVRSGASGNGSSWANAWGNLSSINWSGKIAGDVICVAGGSYSGDIVTGASGNSTSPITVRRATASDPACGSTTSGWSAAYDAQVLTTGITVQNDYVTIDGAVANGIKITLANVSGSPKAIGVGGPTNHVTLRYIEVAGPCGTTACNQNGDARSIDLNRWNGSSFDLQNNMLIQYVNLHGACTIIWSAHSTNGIIEHSRFADSSDSTPGNPNCHPNVIATQDSTNMEFRYNEITNWQVEGIMTCPTNACDSSWDIYGNVWHDPMPGSYPRVLEAQANQNGPYLVYNNTFVNLYSMCANTGNGGSFSSGTLGRNNLYYGNAFSNCGLPNEDYDYSDGSLSGESHGQGNAGNPFVSLSGKNFHLSGDTNSGLTLLPPFNVDYDGNTRGANGIWDRGAYQYITQGPAPAPPTNLNVTVQ